VVTATIPVGDDPVGVAVNPLTNTAYVADLLGTVSVISGKTGTVTSTIPVGRYSQGVAVDLLTSTAYVANGFDNTVSVISG